MSINFSAWSPSNWIVNTLDNGVQVFGPPGTGKKKPSKAVQQKIEEEKSRRETLDFIHKHETKKNPAKMRSIQETRAFLEQHEHPDAFKKHYGHLLK
mmetsp:Transcript_14350/g.17387  ORF Transcript_14350/g.17387 Transcript_14350/m.17387 type:complete len:97 (-) Transcript_14350:46-336(-)|eukprot:CAMPEP_0197866432 /NCGR_PEP_ID=MMETSP1438-20131217/44213_1 /TAXON_ID=1461541 /ORGANISM="Pterosperma sp., Strain CCMP1384" /LENGTH=96 /DNA_ID=CAMNT_0043485001 /DNA_START=114 /DNA_END=404 /DNA_ORIENTATION=+